LISATGTAHDASRGDKARRTERQLGSRHPAEPRSPFDGTKCRNDARAVATAIIIRA